MQVTDYHALTAHDQQVYWFLSLLGRHDRLTDW